MTALERLLGRFTMYRLMIGVLGILAAWALVAAAAGWLDPGIFGLSAMLLTLVVLVASSVVANEAIGRLAGAAPHADSAIITALLLWFLYWPSTEPATLGWLALIAVLAQASKYLIAVRRRHVVNPAAAGVVLAMLLAWATGIGTIPYTTWWAASEILLPVAVVGALLVLYRTGRLDIGLIFVLVAAPLTVWGLTAFGTDLGTAVRQAFSAYPLVFFAGFMLSEPLTLPPRRAQQWAMAAVAGVVFSYPMWSFAAFGSTISVGPFESTYELTLVVTGLAAFALGQRGRVGLTLRERRPLGSGVYEYRFDADRPVRFTPGQYLELHVPHGRADSRGARRALSIASPPGPEVCVAIREPEDASSFKKTLAALPAGTRLAATGVSGDFLLPRDPGEGVLLIASGIGVTPFMSQLRADGSERDMRLVHHVRAGEVQPYAEEIAALGLESHVVSGDLPGWDELVALVPDLAERVVYVSGSPASVDAVRRELRGRVRRIRTDRFLGY
ncbi:FAD-dependent oxidoreductase [Aeromicrobium piscarium]|uniref:Oxidoreductase n=1 Tax=Aeromicrobium piscarium TaxID=2590901 RepID=A0A554S853_9ACTN|nr:oxidoreductase [Aeromicrobium piscarium]TSD62539.1 oxidoreductase [Aeromicrobium piscarium]